MEKRQLASPGQLAHAYTRLRAPLLRVLQRLLPSPHDAEDALHKTFARYANAARQVPEEEQAPYLHRCAVNVARDFWKLPEQKLEHLSLEENIDLLEALAAEQESTDPAALLEQTQRERLLEQAMAELPERQRDVLVWHRIDGLSQSEIAERMGVSRRTVYSQLQAALDYCQQRVRYPSAQAMQQAIGQQNQRHNGKQPADAAQQANHQSQTQGPQQGPTR